MTGRNRAKSRALVWAGVLALTHVVSARAYGADGNQLIGIGTIQKGTAGAGVASPQDSTWTLLNPASIIDLEKRLDFSLDFITLKISAYPQGSVLASNPFAGYQESYPFALAPSVGMILPLEHGTLGFGMFGVQGNLVHYERPRSTLSVLENSDRRAKVQVAKIPVSYAYQFDNGLTVGAGLIGAVTLFQFDSLTLNLRPTDGDNKLDFNVGIGLNFGLYKRWDKVSVGAAYSTRIAVTDLDVYKDVIVWNLDIPQQFQAGIAVRPTQKLELLADYKWIKWSEVRNFGRTTVMGGLGWEDQHIYKLGFNYKATDKWTFRGGYSYGESPIGDEFIFANILTPAFGKAHASLGVSRKIGEHGELHFSYYHAFEEERTDNGRGDIFSILGRGSEASYTENVFSVGYSYRF
ncbi:MAG: hypothetical protein AMXMBFR84_21270 [Candidatus Hydrogenedentota bacterium]